MWPAAAPAEVRLRSSDLALETIIKIHKSCNSWGMLEMDGRRSQYFIENNTNSAFGLCVAK